MTPPEITFEEPPEFPKRRYLLDGEVVPSVTQILGVLNKAALPWWGMTVGVQGILALKAQGSEIPWDDAEGATKLLTEHKLTVNHVRDSAATRGKSVHDALEAFATTGATPRPSQFPAEDRGFVQALARALMDLSPVCEATEIMVGSTEHGYAGRYDLRCRLDGALCRLDAKTGKRVYDEALLQLAAYELAAVEMGEEPSDRLLVLRLGVDGEYEVVESHATAEQFLGVKAAFDALADLKSTRPRKSRAKAVAA
jgi:hypothetical protein